MLDKSLRFREGVWGEGVWEWGGGALSGVEGADVCLIFHFFSPKFTLVGQLKIIYTLWLNLANDISHI